MNLDQQIQTLIDNAPQDGTTPDVVKAIAPALKILAQQLQREYYYILQTVDQSWVLTTLSNLDQPKQEKRVIYAYPTVQDAAIPPDSSEVKSNVVAVPLPVIHILFQMVALKSLDSIIFFETPGNLDMGCEVQRDQVQDLIRTYLQQYRSASQFQPRPIPPDLA